MSIIEKSLSPIGEIKEYELDDNNKLKEKVLNIALHFTNTLSKSEKRPWNVEKRTYYLASQDKCLFYKLIRMINKISNKNSHSYYDPKKSFEFDLQYQRSTLIMISTMIKSVECHAVYDKIKYPLTTKIRILIEKNFQDLSSNERDKLVTSFFNLVIEEVLNDNDSEDFNISKALDKAVQVIEEKSEDFIISKIHEMKKIEEKSEDFIISKIYEMKKVVSLNQHNPHTHLGRGICCGNILKRMELLTVNPNLNNDGLAQKNGSVQARFIQAEIGICYQLLKGHLKPFDYFKKKDSSGVLERLLSSKLGLIPCYENPFEIQIPKGEEIPKEAIKEQLSSYFQSNVSPLLYLEVISEEMEDGTGHAVGIQLDEKNNRFRYFDDNVGIFEFSSKEELLFMVPRIICHSYGNGKGLFHFAGQGVNPLPSKLRQPFLDRYQALSAEIDQIKSTLSEMGDPIKVEMDDGEFIEDLSRAQLAHHDLDRLEEEREEVAVKLIQTYGEEGGSHNLKEAIKIAEKAHPTSKVIAQFRRSFKLSPFAARRRLRYV